MIREECLQFKSTIQPNGVKTFRSVVSSSDREWLVEDAWASDCFGLVQDIRLRTGSEGPFKSYSYASLDIHQVAPDAVPSSELGIQKWKKTLSNNVHFRVRLNEYRHGKGGSIDLVDILEIADRPDSVAAPDSTPDTAEGRGEYLVEIALSPVLKLLGEPGPVRESRKHKKTKGRFISGLKELSSDIRSLLDGCHDEDLDHQLSQQWPEVVLLCGRYRQNAHWSILCARSPRFLRLYRLLQDAVKVDDQSFLGASDAIVNDSSDPQASSSFLHDRAMNGSSNRRSSSSFFRDAAINESSYRHASSSCSRDAIMNGGSSNRQSSSSFFRHAAIDDSSYRQASSSCFRDATMDDSSKRQASSSFLQDALTNELSNRQTYSISSHGKIEEIVTISISALESVLKGEIKDNSFAMIEKLVHGARLAIDLDDIDESIFKDFVDFIYSGQYNPVSYEGYDLSGVECVRARMERLLRTTQRINEAAKNYSMQDLQHKCQSHLNCIKGRFSELKGAVGGFLSTLAEYKEAISNIPNN